ncbi:hypothetical protein [Kineosporia succinea]|uniref:Secreted protein n=1 Tax=Kineosporia succinea TaxID=84632 RepID=A0ABT9PCB8_9ACTN|nr:hypothetical protein [Kineosporia succinea]MDP9830346.1 hypothetical protein [Kineosporia succinea]
MPSWTMTRPARALMFAAAGAALTISPAMTSPALAAGTTNCGTTANGFDHHVVARSRTVGGHTIQLWTGAGFDEDFAKIAAGYRSGDRVWIDKRKTGASTWTQCGPFSRISSNEISNPDSRTQTRACFDYVTGGSRKAYCTEWYTGHKG